LRSTLRGTRDRSVRAGVARELIKATPSETIIGWRERVECVTDEIAYPSVDLILNLHEQIVEEGDTTEPGVRSEDAIASALQYVSEGYFDEGPQTIHEKAVHLMRLLVAEHPFVDGNKRTALRTVVVFYMLNGYTFDYGDEIRALLHRFATDEAAVDTETAVIYFRACARRN
jgi:death-on-curing protein